MHQANRLPVSSSTETVGPRRRHVFTLALAGCAVAGAAAAASDAENEAFYQRASTCAAALQFDQLALVARARAGETDLRPKLFELTKLGFAYVGEAYLKGLRDPRGSDMLKSATAEQKDWPAARHAALVAECRVEAQKVYDNAGMWKWPIDSKANKRVDRFLSMPALPASSASK
jgi:hypothetical protein